MSPHRQCRRCGASYLDDNGPGGSSRSLAGKLHSVTQANARLRSDEGRPSQAGTVQELQVVVQTPCPLQKVVFTGEGEQVVEPAVCGLSVETPGHQFQ